MYRPVRRHQLNDMKDDVIYQLGYFWYNVGYREFCKLVYGGKDDSYTVEKWHKFQEDTMRYLGSLDSETRETFIKAIKTFYERSRIDA
jgi:hypothetical protein